MGRQSEHDSHIESHRHTGEHSTPRTADHVNPEDLRSAVGTEQQRIRQSAGSLLHEIEILQPGRQSPEYKAIQSYDQQVEGQRLRDSVDSRIHQPEARAEFKSNMEDFERRAKEQGLPPDEIAKTYMEISRLLESTGDQPVFQADRVKVARQIM
ncbi:MAG: hypothetical protein HY711_08065, partial [Candidatus Melainabacteria bacterium]|nr:hypothetical protein [Candidatus Melainabacteria bacterium]